MNASLIARQIKEARLAAGLTQASLATAIGRSQMTINRYENNGTRPDTRDLCLIAKACGIPVAFLVGGDGEGPNDA